MTAERIDQCFRCDGRATHDEWLEFDEPAPLPAAVTDILGPMEPYTGCWTGVCETHRGQVGRSVTPTG